MSKTSRNAAISFVVVTVCFALWGFANDITNPMVKAFSKIFKMSTTDGALVQMAFYGGYFAVALPAALFVRRFSYKAGILLGLGLFAVGAFMFYPAALSGLYYPFLIAYFILTCGLSFLETSANPYILTMGDPSRAAFRLNLSQSFNPIGSLLGMYVAMTFIQQRMSPLSAADRALLPAADFEALKAADLSVLIAPYVTLGIVVIALGAIIFLMPMHSEERNDAKIDLLLTLRRLLSASNFRWGFVAQFFYVGAQIMCWTFIIQYGTELFTQRGIPEAEAEVMSQKYNMVAMVLFCVCRFVCTALLRYVRAAKLLAIFSACAVVLTLGVIGFADERGLWALVGVSGCMSLMFPTIYSLALDGLDAEDAKLGAAGQIMAILGGSLLPAVQAMIIDGGSIGQLSAVNLSFVVPMVSFVVVLFFAAKSMVCTEGARRNQ